MIAIRYFFLELKRAIVVMARSMIRILIGIILLTGMVMLIGATTQNNTTFRKLKVAIVMPDQNTITDMAVNLISTMDSVKSVCSFEYSPKERAINGLEDGTYQAVMLLTKDMYQDINSGINTPGRLIFPEASSMEMTVFRELVRDGVWMLQTCESGVYAYLAYLYYNQVPTLEDIGTLLAERYTGVIFNRSGTFDSRLVSPIGSMTNIEYYYLAVIVLILLFMGLQFGCIYQKEEHAFYQEMKTRGVTGTVIGTIKLIVMTFLLWFGACVFYLCGCAFSKVLELHFLWFDGSAILGLFFLCISVAAFFHMLYEIVGSKTEGTVFILIVESVMVLCSGILIPLAYFPELIGKIAPVLPIHFWQELLQKIFYQYENGSGLVICLAVTLAEICVGAFLSWKNY